MKIPPESTGQHTGPQRLQSLVRSPPLTHKTAPREGTTPCGHSAEAPEQSVRAILHGRGQRPLMLPRPPQRPLHTPKNPDRDFDLVIHSVLPEIIRSSKAPTRGLQVLVFSDRHAKTGQSWSRKTLVSSTSLHVPGQMAGRELRAQRCRPSPPHSLVTIKCYHRAIILGRQPKIQFLIVAFSLYF